MWPVMRREPEVKRAVAFVDGQNLFHAAREAFGCTHPNFDVQGLTARICEGVGWQLTQARFYTGIPDAEDNPRWHGFWTAKLAAMGRQGVHVFSRRLRYRNKTVRLPDGTSYTFLAGEEKGIDVRSTMSRLSSARTKTSPRWRRKFGSSRESRTGGSRWRVPSRPARLVALAAASTRRTGFGSTAQPTMPAVTGAITAQRRHLLPRPRNVALLPRHPHLSIRERRSPLCNPAIHLPLPSVVLVPHA